MTVVTSQSKVRTLPPSETRAERVRLDDVTKTYVTDGQPVHALNGVSLSVRQANSWRWSGAADAASPRCSILPAPWTSLPRAASCWTVVSTSELDENGLTRLRREKVGFIFQSFQLLNTLTRAGERRTAAAPGGRILHPRPSTGAARTGGTRRSRLAHAPSALRRTDAACRHRAFHGARPQACCWRMNPPAISTRLPET